mmetsp:Transcript_120586/g.385050  ORF Transcript_120586/g.385050 Transcript_120586/m.385050 type:complete len:203 (-) Transcript_120586:635-1243(-)
MFLQPSGPNSCARLMDSWVMAKRIQVGSWVASAPARAELLVRRTHLRVIFATAQIPMDNSVDVNLRISSRSTSRRIAAHKEDTCWMSSRMRATAHKQLTSSVVDSSQRQCSRQSSALQPFANAPTRPTATSLSLAIDQRAVNSSCGDSSDRRSLLSWMRNLEKRLATHLQPGHLSANLPRAHSVFTSSEAAKLILGDDFTFT